MKINLCISTMTQYQRYPRYVYTSITDEDLLVWAKQYIADNYTDGVEATNVEVESIEV